MLDCMIETMEQIQVSIEDGNRNAIVVYYYT